MFTKYSNKKVWWKCDLGHEWRTAFTHRTRRGQGCPECAKNYRKLKYKEGEYKWIYRMIMNRRYQIKKFFGSGGRYEACNSRKTKCCTEYS